jgi:predicted MPP superfamily phosphohydrolase
MLRMNTDNGTDIGKAAVEAELIARLGPHAHKRLAIEALNEAQRGSFRLREWYLAPALIRGCLRLVGMLQRAQRNALDIRVVENELPIVGLDPAFDGFTLLHLSDLHVDINEAFVPVLIDRLSNIEYDVCVMTGDYRSKIYGPIEATVDGMRRIRAVLHEPIYGVLGNHDSLALVTEFESMGIRMLMNEAVVLWHADARIVLVGIDDQHFYRLGSIAKALVGVASELPSILLSHAPEVYRQAAQAGFDVMLCGHTHGGQICLPGGHAVTVDADVPRRMGRGTWRRRSMVGYTSPGAGTSIVDVRINCPPEITLHRLRCVASLP